MLASASYLLMTAVPLPGISRFTGQEVCSPLVLHPLSKPQQNSGLIILSITGGSGRAEQSRREERCSLSFAIPAELQYG